MTLNEAKYTALLNLTGLPEPITLNELEWAWLGSLGFTAGTLNGRYMQMFRANGCTGTRNECWMEYLSDAGFGTGSINERELGFWLSGGALNPYGNDMVLEFVTTTPGETITIPCQDIGTFDAEIDWGDGSAPSEILAYNSPNLTHAYAAPGSHLVRISKAFPSIQFNNSGDKLKLTKIYQLGDTGLENVYGAFYGCGNLINGNAIGGGGVNVITGCTSGVFMFLNCGKMVVPPDTSRYDTSLFTSISSMFGNNYMLETAPDVENWVLSSLTNGNAAFSNTPLMVGLTLHKWQIPKLTRAVSMILSGKLSTAEYDATLISWSAQVVKSGVEVNFGSSKYTSSNPAVMAARAKLINDDLWILQDGGSV